MAGKHGDSLHTVTTKWLMNLKDQASTHTNMGKGTDNRWVHNSLQEIQTRAVYNTREHAGKC